MPSLATALVIAALPLLGDVHVDADASGRGVLAWSGLNGRNFVAQATEIQDGRRVAAIRTLWRTATNVSVGDVDVAPSGAAAICFLERPRRRNDAWRVRVVLRSAAGRHWSRPYLVAKPGNWTNDVDCGVDNTGNVAIAWTESLKLRASAISPSGAVEQPVTLADDPENPQVEMTPSGVALVGFATGTLDTRRLYVAERAPGRDWSAPVRTPATDEPVQGPLFAVGGDVGRYLAWNGGGDDVTVQLAQGASLPLNSETVATDNAPAVRALSAGTGGDLILAYATHAWTNAAPGTSMLRARIEHPGAPLGPATTLGRFAAYPIEATVATDGTGAIAWVAGTDTRPRIVARILRSDGTWGPMRQLTRTGEKTGLDLGIAASPGATSTVAWSTDPFAPGPATLRIARISG
jgi:hypothetical protein